MSNLTEFEKKMIKQMESTTKSDYYYDNPSAAVDDIEYLMDIVKRFDKIIDEKK
jgi:hypothetical protein